MNDQAHQVPPTTGPTIMNPQQFTMPNNYVPQPYINSYMMPSPSSTNAYSTQHVVYHHHHIPTYININPYNHYSNPYTPHPYTIPMHQPVNDVTPRNTNYIDLTYDIPYTITDAPSKSTTSTQHSSRNIQTTTMPPSSNKTVTRKRQFQSALNTEKLRRARQDERLRLRRSDREQRLHQKKKSLAHYNHKVNNNNKSQNAVRTNESQSKTKLNHSSKNGNTSNKISKSFVSNTKKKGRTPLQQLVLNNKPKHRWKKSDLKCRKLRRRYTPWGHFYRNPTIDESRRREEFPSLQEIDKLKDGEYFIHGKEIIVRCNYKEKNGYSIGFSCPFCFNKYKKNGQPYKRAKPSRHFHGCGSTRENIKYGGMGSCGTRVPHCNSKSKATLGYQFHLYVTPSTKVVVEQK